MREKVEIYLCVYVSAVLEAFLKGWISSAQAFFRPAKLGPLERSWYKTIAIGNILRSVRRFSTRTFRFQKLLHLFSHPTLANAP